MKIRAKVTVIHYFEIEVDDIDQDDLEMDSKVDQDLEEYATAELEYRGSYSSDNIFASSNRKQEITDYEFEVTNE